MLKIFRNLVWSLETIPVRWFTLSNRTSTLRRLLSYLIFFRSFLLLIITFRYNNGGITLFTILNTDHFDCVAILIFCRFLIKIIDLLNLTKFVFQPLEFSYIRLFLFNIFRVLLRWIRILQILIFFNHYLIIVFYFKLIVKFVFFILIFL